MSKLSDQMQKEISAWKDSDLTKKEFLKNKSYSKAKFNYWLNKQYAGNKAVSFEEVHIVESVESKKNKVLEIESPSGVKVSVFL